MRSVSFALALALALVLAAAAPLVAQTSAAPVAAREIARGQVLVAEDIAYSAPGAARDSASVGPGWVTRRVIREGEVLKAPAVAPPQLVRAGQSVVMIWRAGRVDLRLRGQALNSAARGERVHVRIDAQRRFEGEAVAEGTVQLDSRR